MSKVSPEDAGSQPRQSVRRPRASVRIATTPSQDEIQDREKFNAELAEHHLRRKKDDEDSSSAESIGSVASGSIARPSLRKKGGYGHNRTVETKCRAWVLDARTKCSVLFFSSFFLRHRHKAFLIFEILFPLVIALCVIAAFTSSTSWKRSYYEKKTYTEAKIPKFDSITMQQAMGEFTKQYTNHAKKALIIYTPVTDLTKDVMDRTLEELKLNGTNSRVSSVMPFTHGAVGVQDIVDMIEMAILHRNETTDGHGKPIGVVFHDDKELLDRDVYCDQRYFQFTIRHFDLSIADTDDLFPYVKPHRDRKSVPNYVSSGFIGLQYALSISYMKLVRNQCSKIFDLVPTKPVGESIGPGDTIPEVKLNMFYFPSFYNHEIRTRITFVVTFTLVTSYLFTNIFFVRQIVIENRSGIKEILARHNFPQSLHWVLIFFHVFVFRAITAAFMAGILYISFFDQGSVLKLSHWPLIFFYFWMHLLALTFFNFAVATIINASMWISVYISIISIASFVFPASLDRLGLLEKDDYIGNLLLCILFPNWAFYNVIYNVVNLEGDDKGARWDNIDHYTVANKHYLRLDHCLIVLVCSGSAYFFIAQAVNMNSTRKLFPPVWRWWELFEWFRLRSRFRNRLETILGYEKPKGCCSFCRPMKRPHRKKPMINPGLIEEEHFEEVDDTTQQDRPAIYETPSPECKCYVRVRHLCKRFGQHNIALDTVDFDIVHEEICVVLGHNGSGKSTLLSIIAGLIRPTSGYVSVKNHDVIFESKKARKLTGYSAQQLIYHNLLTVKEHLYLIYRLRGYSSEDSVKNLSTLLTRLGLWNIRKSYPGDSLNLDEQRRLNLAMAIADSPKVLILDDPTAGMDGFSRRQIWTLLKLLKSHHTIIVATNYMDEAEYLADRIALLAHGRLACYGSPDFLKRQYDTGYFLRCSPFKNVILDASAILAIVRARLGDKASEKRNSSIKEADDVIIQLPMANVLELASLCDDMEKHFVRLGIRRYSFKRVGLPEIFTKICEAIAVDKDATDVYVRRDSAGDIKTSFRAQIPTMSELTEFGFPSSKGIEASLRVRLKALISIKVLFLISEKARLIWDLCLPFVLIFLVVYESKQFAQGRHEPSPRNLTYDLYPAGVKLLHKIFPDKKYAWDKRFQNVTAAFGEKPQLEAVDQKKRMSAKFTELYKLDTNDEIGDIKEKHFTALELTVFNNVTTITGHFASGAVHSSPIILNVIMNLLLNALFPLEQEEKYHIFANNYPFPFTRDSWKEEGVECGGICVTFAILLSFAFGFICSTTVVFPLRQRWTGLKHIQHMTGVSVNLYWLTNWVVDFLVMLIVSTLVLSIFVFDTHRVANNTEHVLVLFLISILYLGWAGLSFSYFASSLIPEGLRGFGLLFGFHTFFGILPFCILEVALGSNTFGLVVFLRYFFMIIPGFTITCAILEWFKGISRASVCRGLSSHVAQFCNDEQPELGFIKVQGHFKEKTQVYDHVFHTNVRLAKCCQKMCEPQNKCFQEPGMLNSIFESWVHPGLITHIVALVLTGILFWILIFLFVESKYFPRLGVRITRALLEKAKDKDKGKGKGEGQDEKAKELAKEEVKVKKTLKQKLPPNVAFLIQSLAKTEASSMVVNEINLQVKNGDCIGILGAARSGKSCIMRLISGNEEPTQGNCFTQDGSLTENRTKYLRNFGYCPQQNPILLTLSGINMLELIGRLRGIPEQMLSLHVTKWLQVVGLQDVGKEPCGSYSNGMQRLLSCAMALIGSSSETILLLDEATTDVGPIAKGRFWAILQYCKSQGTTIIFTTFHTQECVTLADKMLVLYEGNIQTLGQPEELQKRYARGYILMFRLRIANLKRRDVDSRITGKIVEFKDAVQDTFEYCEVLDEQDSIIMFFLRDTKIFWNEVFRKMHMIGEEFSEIISGFDISESSIEDLFIYLANKYLKVYRPRRLSKVREENEMLQSKEMQAIEKAARALHIRL